MRAQKSRKCVSERVSESERERKNLESLIYTADMKKFFRLVFLTTFEVSERCWSALFFLLLSLNLSPS